MVRHNLLRFLNGLATRFYARQYRDIFRKDFSRDLFAGEVVRSITWPASADGSGPLRQSYSEASGVKARLAEASGVARAAFNLNLDDFSTQSRRNSRYDYGGAVGEGVNKILGGLMAAHPELRVTLFAVPCAHYVNSHGIFYGTTWHKGRFSLAHPANRPLIAWLKSLAPRLEVAIHGYHHFRSWPPLFLAAAEFEFASREESLERLCRALDIFASAGLSVSGFRPPAWGIGYNSDFGLLSALRDLSGQDTDLGRSRDNAQQHARTIEHAHGRNQDQTSFKYVSASSPLSGLNWDRKRVSNIYPERYEGLLNLPQNVSLAWPTERILETVSKIVQMGGLVSLMGHMNAEDHWMEDGLGPRNLAKIEAVLEYLRREHAGKIWFATLAEIADFWHRIAHGPGAPC
ncbi:MAG: DUF2334 domain-containing protein [Candidatus Liptonbacteria bacterium]|nr:DUF2334 domain-containing protein [Candidatus Liptonbacteria bacterium]